MPRASHAQKTERLNCAWTLLRQGESLSGAVERLAQAFSLSPRQAYRYLQQAEDQTEPVSAVEVKRAFTVKLPHLVIRRVRAYATSKRLAISEVATRGLLVQLPGRETTPGAVNTPDPEKTSIALDVVEALASIGCMLDDIYGIVGVSARTLTAPSPEKTAIALEGMDAPLESACCKFDDIYAFVGICPPPPIRPEQEGPFAAAIERGRARGRESLRRKQWKAAKAGNTRALIRLGIQMLGQRCLEGEAQKNDLKREAEYLKEAATPAEATMAFTVMLPVSMIERIRTLE